MANLKTKTDRVETQTIGYVDTDYIVDGTSDDVQILDALTKISADGGGNLFMKRGAYNTDVIIPVPSNVNIIAEGVDVVTVKTTAVLNGSVFMFDGVSNSSISNLTIDGNAAVNVPVSGDLTNNGITIDGTCSNLTFDNVKVKETGGNGFYTTSSAVTNKILLRNCEADTPGTRGAYIQSDGVTIMGGEFHDAVFHDGVQYEGCNNGLVFGAKAYNNVSKGFECQVSASNVQFINCETYDNGAAGAEFANGCTNVDFFGLQSHDNGGAGVTFVQ